MSSPRGFRYGLQPVLLTRRWLYERLQRDLGDVNRVLRQHEEVLRRVQRECDAACAEWVALTHAEYRPDEFLRHHGFIARLREEEGRCHDLLRDTRQRRDAIRCWIRWPKPVISLTRKQNPLKLHRYKSHHKKVESMFLTHPTLLIMFRTSWET